MGEAKTSLVGKEASNPKTVWFGLDSISSALQTITGSKWAEDAVRNRGAPKKTSSEPLRYRSDPIAWEEVESHASADSCWIVVKSKVLVYGMCADARDCCSIQQCPSKDWKCRCTTSPTSRRVILEALQS